MIYSVGEYEFDSGKVKYMSYSTTKENQKINTKIRPIIGKIFRLSDMEDLKLTFLFKLIPDSGEFPTTVLSNYINKYGNNDEIILMNQRISNPYSDTSTLDAQEMFKKESMNIGFANIVWNTCMADNSIDWFIYMNKYAKSWMSTRVGMGDGKLISRYFVKDETTDSIITKTE